MKIIMTSVEALLCDAFAEECVKTNVNHYAKRRQTNIDKITEQIAQGKLAEVAVAKLLDTTPPDFTIYKPREKKFDADMVLGDRKIHVKSCARNSKYPISWVFQFGNGGKGHTDPLLKTEDDNDLIALVIVNGAEVELFGLVRATEMTEKDLYKDPILKWLVGVKKVLYADDVKKYLLKEFSKNIEKTKSSRRDSENGE